MSEILKSWLGKLYAWAFPSALFFGALWLALLSNAPWTVAVLEAYLQDQRAAAFLAATGVLSVTLYAISTPLYRILEGYLLWPAWLQKAGVAAQMKRRNDLKQIAGQGWARGLALERLGRYPIDDRQIVPTRFGNALRAFETYGKTRFNLDSQTLWHELSAVVPKYIVGEIESARASVDFYIALFYCSLLFVLACLGFAAFENGVIAYYALPGAAVMIFAHWMAVHSVDAWSYAVQALVNLGRVKLAKTLGLRLPDTLEDERDMWGLVTRHVGRCDLGAGAMLDLFRVSDEASAGSAGSEDKAADGDDDEVDDADDAEDDKDEADDTDDGAEARKPSGPTERKAAAEIGGHDAPPLSDHRVR